MIGLSKFTYHLPLISIFFFSVFKGYVLVGVTCAADIGGIAHLFYQNADKSYSCHCTFPSTCRKSNSGRDSRREKRSVPHKNDKDRRKGKPQHGPKECYLHYWECPSL